MAHYLVVAHRTLVGPELLDEVQSRVGPDAAFHLLVPVEHPSDHAWSQGEVQAKAAERLAEGLDRFRQLGVAVDGTVGDVDPVTAITTVIRDRTMAGEPPFDEVLLSTLARGPSRWLKLDVVSRTRERTGLPVTHVAASRDTALR